MTYCRNEIELEAYERNQERLDQKEKQLLRDHPVEDFMPEAVENMWKHSDYECLVSLVEERPSEILRLLFRIINRNDLIPDNAANRHLRDGHLIKNFISEWLRNEAKRLQAKFIEEEMTHG